VISGLVVALECTALPVLTIACALLGAYVCGLRAMPGVPGAGLYGTAVATMGMLSTVAYVLSLDIFGPITDNAGGIVEMSGQPEDARARTDRLDAVGNTTKAVTKGYAIGSASLAAFLLFSAYLDEITLLGRQRLRALGDPAWSHYRFEHVDVGKPPVFVAALVGAMVVFVFSAWAIKAVVRDAHAVIDEVRRQFREHPGIMSGAEKPEFGRCVDIVTVGALRGMVAPGLLVVSAPVLIGVLGRLGAPQDDATLGAECVAATLMIGTIAGVLLALMMNTGGGAWDNAKKSIERGAFGGKRSKAHEAAVVGDAVGDPFKDTAGPSLHVLVKLLGTVSLVAAPLFA
jgi:K(+)-stimulated pyrophosphate-energized sodium pump